MGGAIGAFIAFKIPMTAMPELVAGFHSLVGLAAVFVAISAFLNPEIFKLGYPGDIKIASLIEMSLGAAIGAITFTGSIIAFEIKRYYVGFTDHICWTALFKSCTRNIIDWIDFCCKTQSEYLFWSLIIVSFLVGILLIFQLRC